MANRTVKDAKSVRGTNPQYLVEKIIRSRVYDSKYWKEECFALSAELLVDKAMELRYIGGVFGGNIKPTPFLCLILKMLQIQPEKDIIVEFIKNEEFKYVRALGAYYMRLVGTSLDCYKYLEPLFNDSRKLRRQNRQGQFELVHMDEFIDELLREERMCDIILPRIQKRYVMEENNEIEPKISALDDDLDEGIESSGDDDDVATAVEKIRTNENNWSKKRDERKRSPERARSPERDRNRERDRKNRERERIRERGHRERSRSRERRHRSKSPTARYRKDDREKERPKFKRNEGDRWRDRDMDRGWHDREQERDKRRDRDRERDRPRYRDQ
ncbi:pre-mRNA-splicing factor 38 [Nilaparvata lugens]|uniref:pre-mRNA-splicing factor 38 n=1 Tax=Nilaparvata lugens TaxID=108931 RepID=UPI00193CBB93|nr:pre-mRNA-splicing factor 38 [Nilaparvata lugens]